MTIDREWKISGAKASMFNVYTQQQAALQEGSM
jgi:hypothetical protein